VSSKTTIVGALTVLLQQVGFYVTRKLNRLQDLGAHQLPAVSITNGYESMTAVTTGPELYVTWDLHLVPYVKELTDPQGALDEANALITRTLLADRTLGGLVIDLDLVSRDTDRGVFDPFAAGDLVFRIQYQFHRTTEGG
jgi:hypothetical protein